MPTYLVDHATFRPPPLHNVSTADLADAGEAALKSGVDHPLLQESPSVSHCVGGEGEKGALSPSKRGRERAGVVRILTSGRPGPPPPSPMRGRLAGVTLAMSDCASPSVERGGRAAGSGSVGGEGAPPPH